MDENYFGIAWVAPCGVFVAINPSDSDMEHHIENCQSCSDANA